MRDIQLSPEQTDSGRASPAARALRSGVRELMLTARSEAAADTSAVARGCRGAALLRRSEAIRSRSGLPPNPVRDRAAETTREEQVTAAYARQRDQLRGWERAQTRFPQGSAAVRFAAIWRLPRRLALKTLRLIGGW
jgi:hypothetical protein